MKKDNTNENKVLSVREGRAVMKVLAINVQSTFKKCFVTSLVFIILGSNQEPFYLISF